MVYASPDIQLCFSGLALEMHSHIIPMETTELRVKTSMFLIYLTFKINLRAKSDKRVLKWVTFHPVKTY